MSLLCWSLTWLSTPWRHAGVGVWRGQEAVCSFLQAGSRSSDIHIAPSLTPYRNNNNNNNTIWRGSVLTGEEPPPHSGELKHALPQAGGPTQSQLSRPMSSGHHISIEHRLRRKQQKVNSDTNASNKTYLKATQEKRKRKNKKVKKKKMKIYRQEKQGKEGPKR